MLAFLAALIYLDSYKLIRRRDIALYIVLGAITSVLAALINDASAVAWHASPSAVSRYVAPVVEELLKALVVVAVIERGRVGFVVDAAIAAFAVGAGFAVVENVLYAQFLHDGSLALWLVRGFGTAVMHGGATTLFAITAKSWIERDGNRLFAYPVSWIIAVLVHSGYNHFLLPPLLTTALVCVVMPVVVVLAFYRGENATRRWLGPRMDVEMELLALVESEHLSRSHLGQHLRALREHLPAELVVDMLCYLRVRTELSLASKGVLLMRKSGIKPSLPPDITEKLAELSHLEHAIGRTGRLAVAPFIRTSSRDVWELKVLAR